MMQPLRLFDIKLNIVSIRQLPISFAVLTSLVLGSGLQSCTWVKATPGGEKVVVSDGSGISNCEKKGEVESALKSRVAGVERNATKVQQELETLARNEAAKMGGDTIVAISNVRDGKKDYAVYLCRS